MKINRNMSKILKNCAIMAVLPFLQGLVSGPTCSHIDALKLLAGAGRDMQQAVTIGRPAKLHSDLLAIKDLASFRIALGVSGKVHDAELKSKSPRRCKERAGITGLSDLRKEKRRIEEEETKGTIDAETKHWKDAIEHELNHNDERWIREQYPVDGGRYQMSAVSPHSTKRYRNFAFKYNFYYGCDTLSNRSYGCDTFTFLERGDGTWCMKSDSQYGEATYSVYAGYDLVKQSYGTSNYGANVDNWRFEPDGVVDGEVRWKIKAGDKLMAASVKRAQESTSDSGTIVCCEVDCEVPWSRWTIHRIN